MVLMYPTPCSTVNLLSCDHQEYRAWVDSLINNPYFSAFVSKSLQTKHFKNAQIEVLKSTSAWEQLLLIIMDHHAKEECVGNWLSNSVLRERKAKMLRLVSIMAMRSFTLKAERNINNYLMGKDLSSEIKRCNIYEALGDYIFNRPVLNLFEKFSVATGSRSLLSHSQNIEAIMGELGVLSSRASG